MNTDHNLTREEMVRDAIINIFKGTPDKNLPLNILNILVDEVLIDTMRLSDMGVVEYLQSSDAFQKRINKVTNLL